MPQPKQSNLPTFHPAVQKGEHLTTFKYMNVDGRQWLISDECALRIEIDPLGGGSTKYLTLYEEDTPAFRILAGHLFEPANESERVAGYAFSIKWTIRRASDLKANNGRGALIFADRVASYEPAIVYIIRAYSNWFQAEVEPSALRFSYDF